ncbi:peptidase M23 [Mucilaginibacter sp. PPCGB 2223]|uniref:peptidoglycan DD-metalloendopeptidase family protein n=1 Tax=Mucilaginibacter sp. PPCGB 2223 TaxID=1886027 RepID=UPI0008253A08|nr:peptidoglycan DD-metalloendopeptidase family protein [Mucilaginibacter sp. PPCGB 2223]OCX51111.1 peptidase M23 [Mucilaginibacter sp. PPCGB 2223]
MDKHRQLKQYIARHGAEISKVVYVDPKRHQLLPLDFTAGSKQLSPEIIGDTFLFSEWLFKTLKEKKCKYGIGGYFEHRTLYNNKPLFNTDGEPRNVHLGVDVWGDAGTMVKAPMQGIVHSFADNSGAGNYGPTIILEHDLDGLKLYSLYGHLSTDSLLGLSEGMAIEKDETLGEFGSSEENGGWAPHLHFQLMFDMQGWKGDYPGACRASEEESYRQNIADPNLILRFPEQVIIK